MAANPNTLTNAKHWVPDGAEVLFDGVGLRAYIQDAASKRLVVSFDNFRPTRTGFPEPRRTYYFKSHNYASLHIDTSRNDWFLSDELPALLSVLADRTAQYRHRAAMGFSMGGYGALRFARCLKLRQVLLVSPQISVLPGRVPWDLRYRAHGQKLSPSLDDVMTDPYTKLSGVALFDPAISADRRHARLIASVFPAITPVAMPFGGHPASAPVVEAGLFDAFRSAVAGGLIEPERFKSLHRRARVRSKTYAKNYAKWIGKRFQT